MRGFDPVLGARPLRRTIQREIEDILSEKMLFGEVGPGQIVLVDVEGEGPTATFTFQGSKVGTMPDLPPIETAEVDPGDVPPAEGPDDSEGRFDVPKAALTRASTHADPPGESSGGSCVVSGSVGAVEVEQDDAGDDHQQRPGLEQVEPLAEEEHADHGDARRCRGRTRRRTRPRPGSPGSRWSASRSTGRSRRGPRRSTGVAEPLGAGQRGCGGDLDPDGRHQHDPGDDHDFLNSVATATKCSTRYTSAHHPREGCR